jgi:hypothetical protein
MYQFIYEFITLRYPCEMTSFLGKVRIIFTHVGLDSESAYRGGW